VIRYGKDYLASDHGEVLNWTYEFHELTTTWKLSCDHLCASFSVQPFHPYAIL